jgi:hypothetical protein
MVNLTIALLHHMRPMDLWTCYGTLIELTCTDTLLVLVILRAHLTRRSA